MTPAKKPPLGKSISVANAKGGVGKTTVSLTLAGALASAGQRVQLVDLDPQGGAMTWAGIAEKKGREPTFQVGTTPAQGFDWTIYDHPPGLPQRGNLPGQLVLVPMLLDKGNYAATLRFIQELHRQGATYLVLPNRVEMVSSEQSEMMAQLFAGQPHLRKRTGLQRAYNAGVTIYDERNGVPLSSQIRDEFDEVMTALMALARGEPPRQYTANGQPVDSVSASI